MARRRKDKQEDRAERRALVDRIMTVARECGVIEDKPQLWVGVLKILKDEDDISFFLASNPAGRKALIEHYAGVDN